MKRLTTVRDDSFSKIKLIRNVDGFNKSIFVLLTNSENRTASEMIFI